MSEPTSNKNNELLKEAVSYQNTPTETNEDDWSDFSETSDAESDKFENLNDIFGSPATDFSYDHRQAYEDEISSGNISNGESTGSDGFFERNFGNPCNSANPKLSTKVSDLKLI